MNDQSVPGRVATLAPPLQELSLSRSTVDRLSDSRAQPGVLDEWWADPSTLVLRVAKGRTPVLTDAGGPPRLDLVPPTEVTDSSVRALLGRGDDGARYLAAEVPEPSTDGETDTRWLDLRSLGTVLDDTQAGLLTQAVGLFHWHAVHPRCPRCGAATDVVVAGWVRRCPVDSSEHFPRTDPAVIMSVVDDAGRILLGHNDAWPPERYSALAGFVEPGESLEAAVRREVAEEVGVVIGEVTYLGSQPWPFPASLMLGFQARATTTSVTTDDVEITAARWFSREQLAAAVASRDVKLPPQVSIARRLIEHWYGEAIDDDADW